MPSVIVRVDPNSDNTDKDRRHIGMKLKIDFNVNLLFVYEMWMMCMMRTHNIYIFI